MTHSAPAPRFLVTASRRWRSLHIGDRPAHPLRVVAEKSQPQIAGMAKETPHDLALVIDAQLAFLLPAYSVAAAIAFTQRLVIIKRYSVNVFETRLQALETVLSSVLRIGFSPLAPARIDFVLVRCPILASTGKLLPTVLWVVRIFLSVPVFGGHGSTDANCPSRARSACRDGTRRAQVRTLG